MNIQPVVPFTLNADWHVISRTILPVMFNQNDLFPGSGSQSGLRDTTEGLYFSPSRTFNGFTIGAGPILLLPTATDELLGAGKWGAGPTGVVVWQGSGWTVGILAYHNWSFAGDADRAEVDQTFLQPVIAYTTSKAWTFTLQGEDTYNWETGEWLAPVNFIVSKIVKIDGQPVSIVGGVRYWMRFSRHRSPWFWRPARDDIPVSDAMIKRMGVARKLRPHTAHRILGVGKTGLPTNAPNAEVYV